MPKSVRASKVNLRKEQIKYLYSPIISSHDSKKVYVKITIFTWAIIFVFTHELIYRFGALAEIVIYWPLFDSVDTDVERKLVCFIVLCCVEVKPMPLVDSWQIFNHIVQDCFTDNDFEISLEDMGKSVVTELIAA